MSKSTAVLKSFKTHRRNKLRQGGQGVDPFGQSVHEFLIYPIEEVKTEVASNSAPNINGSIVQRTVYIDIPQDMTIDHVFVSCPFGQSTTEDYRDNLMVGAFEKVAIVNNSKEKLIIDEPEFATMWAFNKLDQTSYDELVSVMGGTFDSTTAGDTVYGWLPFCFDKWITPEVEAFRPDQLKKPQLKLVFKGLTDLGKATISAGSITGTVTAVFYGHRLHNQSGPIKSFKSFAYDLNVSKTTVPTATSTNIDIKSMGGMIKEISIFNQTVTSYASDFHTSSGLDELADKINNESKTYFTDQPGGLIDTMVYNRSGPVSSVDHNKIMYSYNGEGYLTNDLGGIDSGEVQNHVLTVKHSVGSDTNVSVLGIVGAKYEYTNDKDIVVHI